MTLSRFPFLFAPILVGLIISSAWAQPFQSILSKLDQNYYYPQVQGLNKLSAQVQWEQLDVASGSGKFLRNPDLIFSWQKSSSDGLGEFRLAQKQDEERFEKLVQHIGPFREMIIPLTLMRKFSSFKGDVHKTKNGKLVVKLSPPNNSSLNYKLLVDSKEAVIKKVRFKQSRSPENVEGEMSYLKLDGKYAISESRSTFEIKEQKYSEVTRFKYKEVDGVWVVHRIDQTLKQEDYVLQTHVIKLSDFQITSSH
jgi:hypothetical protein